MTMFAFGLVSVSWRRRLVHGWRLLRFDIVKKPVFALIDVKSAYAWIASKL
jgi:hypothetical protein